MSEENNGNALVRYIGRIKDRICNGQNGQFTKKTIWIDNPEPNKEDGSENQYHKGSLLWLDRETGETFQVKQIELAGVSQDTRDRGFSNSIRIDLGSSYHVKKLV